MPISGRITYLFERYYEGLCTESEKAELMTLLQQAGNEEQFKELIGNALREGKVSYRLPEENAGQILEAILEGSRASENARRPERSADVVPHQESPSYGSRHKKGLVRWLYGKRRSAAAACLALALAGGIYFWQASLTRPAKEPLPERLAEGRDILPGSDRAQLVLDDGSVIDLEAASDGQLSVDGGLVMKAEGQLVYDGASAGPKPEPAYHTVKTPKAGQYRLVLPDGSLVWLNAQSSLRFPTMFSGDERRVELNGEAYFEVKEDPESPFRVETDDAGVQVLGTHFNVQAYPNEPELETTLLEGRVMVRTRQDAFGPPVSEEGSGKSMQGNTETGMQVILEPGQQARVNGEFIKVDEVDTSGIVAWKNGVFHFDNADLKGIMRQLERWYDVRVDYSAIPDKRYNGTVLRNSNLADVLRMLEVAGEIRFEISDRTIRTTN